jgi:DNA-binding beta-propeller fold protein YncE
MLRKLKVLCLVGVVVALAACGDDGIFTYLMGGSIQGRALFLKGDVSTLLDTLEYPLGITTDGKKLYWVDYNDGAIYQMDRSGHVTTLSDDFIHPVGITTDGKNVYVTDVGDGSVTQVKIATGDITILEDPGTFINPSSITTDMKGNLYLTDETDDTVSKIVIATGDVTLIDDTLTHPAGITTDGKNLFVNDFLDGTVSKIVIATGDLTTVASGFDHPASITSDGFNLYWVNQGDSTISKMVIATKVVTTIATLPAGSDYGITTDGNHLFVTDWSNHTLSEIK